MPKAAVRDERPRILRLAAFRQIPGPTPDSKGFATPAWAGRSMVRGGFCTVPYETEANPPLSLWCLVVLRSLPRAQAQIETRQTQDCTVGSTITACHPGGIDQLPTNETQLSSPALVKNGLSNETLAGSFDPPLFRPKRWAAETFPTRTLLID
ncbi:hypothetical protein VTI74DRAFT_3699 [Chaetomium olivicolor]